MKTSNGGGSSLQELARLGAPMRLKAIEAELQSLYTLFPDLFPAGLPVISKPERKAVEASSAAQRLIDGAEALHARARGNGKRLGRPAGSGKKARKQRSPNVPTMPQFDKITALTSADRLSASEAAEIFGCSTSNIYLHVKGKLLKPADHKGLHYGARFRADDLKAVLLKRAQEIWQEQHKGENAEQHTELHVEPGSEQGAEHVQEQSV